MYCRHCKNLGWVKKGPGLIISDRVITRFAMLQQSPWVPIDLLRRYDCHQDNCVIFVGLSWCLQIMKTVIAYQMSLKTGQIRPEELDVGVTCPGLLEKKTYMIVWPAYQGNNCWTCLKSIHKTSPMGLPHWDDMSWTPKTTLRI